MRSWPTDEEAREAVIATARRIHEVMWTWTWPDDPNGVVHSETEAIGIAKACLYLGEPVTDRVSSRYMVSLVERVARLEALIIGEGNKVDFTRVYGPEPHAKAKGEAPETTAP